MQNVYEVKKIIMILKNHCLFLFAVLFALLPFKADGATTGYAVPEYAEVVLVTIVSTLPANHPNA